MKHKLIRIAEFIIIAAMLACSLAGCTDDPRISGSAPAGTAAGPADNQNGFVPSELYSPFKEYSGLYKLDGLLKKDFVYLDSCLNGGRLLVLRLNTVTDELWAVLMDISDSSIISEQSLGTQDYSVSAGAAGRDGFYILFDTLKCLRIYDRGLTQIAGADYSSYGAEQIYIHPSGDAYWYYDTQNSRIVRVPVNGDTPDYFPMDVPGQSEQSFVSVRSSLMNGSYLLLSQYGDAQTLYLYDLKNKSYTSSRFLIQDTFICGSYLAFSSDGKISYTDLAAPGLSHSFSLECGDPEITGQYEIDLNMTEKWFATAQYDEKRSVLRIYDMQTGLPAARLAIEQNEPLSFSSIHFAQDYAVITLFDGEDAEIVLWDCFKEKEIKGDPAQALSALGQYDYPSMNAQLKARISEKGINVLYGEDAGTEFPDYRAEIITDPKTIHKGLAKLLETAEKFPDGFFRDLMSDEVTGIDVYLCGAFTPVSQQSGIDTASAFAVIHNNRQIIAMNLDYLYSFEQTLAHEFMHAAERRIQQLVFEGGINDGFILWDSFLPDNYYYANSYRAPDGTEYDSSNRPEYTPYDPDSFDDPANIYFIDGYATTFAGEDMARIFENLFIADEELPSFFESPNLRVKAEYLCAVIRQSLPSVAAVKTAVWERHIDIKPVSWFMERYQPVIMG